MQFQTIKIASVLSCIALLWSCSNQPAEMSPPPVLDVDFIEIKRSSAQIEKRYPATIEGSVNVDIKAQVSGYLEHIFVKEGDYVQKGQSLFKIKSEVYDEQVNNNKALYEAAVAAEQSASIELDKIKPLVEGKVYTQVQLDAAKANYAAAKARTEQARIAINSSEINAAFSLIKAPVSGYIGRIPNRLGNLVTPADLTPLTTLSEINTVFVYFSLSEADFIAYAKDSKTDQAMNVVELVMADGTIYPQTGKLEMASGNISRSTGSIPLKAVFNNPDKLLRSGGSGKIVLKKTLNDVIAIPMAGVIDIQDRYFVFTLADSNKVAMKPIEVAGKTGDSYIVKSGLQTGEKLVINRIDALNDGMQVVPTPKSN